MHPYITRYSRKAKHLQLRIIEHRLEVIIPEKKHISSYSVEQFIQKKQAWIKKNIPTTNKLTLPSSIELPAINQTWEVRYIPTSDQNIHLTSHLSKQIILNGNISHIPLCIKILRQWLRALAIDYLPQKLTSLACQKGFSFKRVTIRHNLTRWGSCSSKKNISLSCRLLLLPQDLMHHVLLHELCHTQIMHHGKDFWKLLERFDHLTEIHKKQLRQIGKQLPSWS